MSAYISEMKLVAQKVERALCSVHKGGLPLSLPSGDALLCFRSIDFWKSLFCCPFPPILSDPD